MGLDFTLYKKLKTETENEAWDIICKDHVKSNWGEYSPRELAYGRKSWELVHFLFPEWNDSIYDEGDSNPILEKVNWDKLMTAMEPIGNKLDAIIEAFSREEYVPNDYGDFIFTDEHKKLIAEYEYWYNKTFEDTPYLGYDFSAYYMREFWNANEKVQEVFNNPEWEVRGSISY